MQAGEWLEGTLGCVESYGKRLKAVGSVDWPELISTSGEPLV